VVVEGATVTLANGATTMLALGILLNVAGIGLFCWLIFTLAVHALPFFVAVSAGMMALHSGAGALGAPLVGIAAGGMALAVGQVAFAMARSVILRAIIAPCSLCRLHLSAIMPFSSCHRSGCLRLLGERFSPASVRPSLAARRGRG
jgi:hypothetical protein